MIADFLDLLADERRDLRDAFERRSPAEDGFLDVVLVLGNFLHEQTERLRHLGHELFRDGQERCADRALELPELHLHLLPFKPRLMAFLWIQQARRFDVRRDLHEVLVLLEKRNERRATRTEDFGSVGFFLPHVNGVLVALRELG